MQRVLAVKTMRLKQKKTLLSTERYQLEQTLFEGGQSQVCQLDFQTGWVIFRAINISNYTYKHDGNETAVRSRKKFSLPPPMSSKSTDHCPWLPLTDAWSHIWGTSHTPVFSEQVPHSHAHPHNSFWKGLPFGLEVPLSETTYLRKYWMLLFSSRNFSYLLA